MIFRDSKDLEYIKGFPYPVEEHKALVIKVEKGKFVCYKPSLMRRLKWFVQDKLYNLGKRVNGSATRKTLAPIA